MPMPLKRRYCKYSFEDTQRAFEQQHRQLKVNIVPGTSSKNGRRVGIQSKSLDKMIIEAAEQLQSMTEEVGVESKELDKMVGVQIHAAVILARSSDWYRYKLNTYAHDLACAIVGTHDSCLEVPVLAMDTLEWYGIDAIRFEKSLAPASKGTINPSVPMDRETNPDLFEARYRKTRYGHAVLVGSLIRGRKDGRDRLMTLPDRTRLRIEAEVRHLRKRRSGRPLLLWESPLEESVER